MTIFVPKLWEMGPDSEPASMHYVAAGRMWIEFRDKVELGQVGTSWTPATEEHIEYFKMMKKKPANICTFQIPFSQCSWPQWMKLFCVVFSAWGNLLVCKISNFTDTRNMFFAIRSLIFDKYPMPIIFLQSLYCFSPVRTGIVRFG